MANRPNNSLLSFFKTVSPAVLPQTSPKEDVQPASASASAPTPTPTPTPTPAPALVPAPPSSSFASAGLDAMWPDKDVYRGGHVPLPDKTLPSSSSSLFSLRRTPETTLVPSRCLLSMSPPPSTPPWQPFSCSVCQHIHTATHSKESRPWREKYSPGSIQEMMGNKNEAKLLWDWLRYKKVANGPRSVHDDLELENLTLLENEVDKHGYITYAGFQRVWGNPFQDKEASVSKKKLKRDREEREASLVLMVGPTGIGKTAAVYAAAKEIGYDVFEVHPGMRRSGKDVIAAVGAMTESHQVAFSKSSRKRPHPTVSVLPSKRQIIEKPKPAMNSLMWHFTRVPHPVKKELQQEEEQVIVVDEKEEDLPIEEAVPDMTDTEQVLPTKQVPKESLILLEQVDILFEEDKGFWAAVEELSIKSKRPIVLTCNERRCSTSKDPSTIPMNNLRFHAVLTLGSPPTDVLLPWLQLVCFSEGYWVHPVDLICFVAWLGNVREILNTLEMWCPRPTKKEKKEGEGVWDCRGLFGAYVGLMSYEMEPTAMCNPHTTIDKYALCKVYCELMYAKEESSVDSFSLLFKGLDTASFQDAWIDGQSQMYTADQSIEPIRDSIHGITTIYDMASEFPISQEIQTTLHSFNQRVTNTRGAGSWESLNTSRKLRLEAMMQASERILPTRTSFLSNAMEQLDYLPAIQSMCHYRNPRHGRNRTLRSRRYQPYLALKEEQIAILKSKSFENEIDQNKHLSDIESGFIITVFYPKIRRLEIEMKGHPDMEIRQYNIWLIILKTNTKYKIS
ncbi:hypothetical protein BDF14DRAFT_1954059 [Spinellus fusiger]|nr:hypothetical protein BDF14DRAFT_1954059 [Spinellus fusiger]